MDFKTYISAIERKLSQMTEIQKTDFFHGLRIWGYSALCRILMNRRCRFRLENKEMASLCHLPTLRSPFL